MIYNKSPSSQSIQVLINQNNDDSPDDQYYVSDEMQSIQVS
jgi:hypothetical protein